MSETQEGQTKQTRPVFVAEEEVPSRISVKQALIPANRFPLETMRDRFTAGSPKQLIFSSRSVWDRPLGCPAGASGSSSRLLNSLDTPASRSAERARIAELERLVGQLTFELAAAKKISALPGLSSQDRP